MKRRPVDDSHDLAFTGQNGLLCHPATSNSDTAGNESARSPIGVVVPKTLHLNHQSRPRWDDRSLPCSLTTASEIERDQQQPTPLDAFLDFSSSSSYASSVSTTSADTSVSLELNPSSSVEHADLPGIALLKEIFPNESTQALRTLHYQRIMFHKTKASSRGAAHEVRHAADADESGHIESLKLVSHAKTSDAQVAIDGETEECNVAETEDTPIEGSTGRSNVVADRMASPRKFVVPKVELPDDFLRLPKSVAVLRRTKSSAPLQSDFSEDVETETNKDDHQARYVFVADLELQAMQEYHLALQGNGTHEDRAHPVEYLTIVVDKDPRWGLGMTLQEEEDATMTNTPRQQRLSQQSSNESPSEHEVAVPYGLQVVGFLPDREKIVSGDIVSQIARSPSDEAGIQLNDVLIGINGSAFLLPPPSAVYQNNELYKFHKGNIIHSIQQSPNPVVLHIRRRCRQHQSLPTGQLSVPSPTGRSSSLLDNTFLGEVEGAGEASFSEDDFNIASSMPSPQRPRDSPHDVLPASTEPTLTPPLPKPLCSSSSATVHPLSKALMKRKLIGSRDDQIRITRRLQHFMERTRQWESSNSLRICVDSSSGGLVPCFDPNDLPPDMAALMTFSSSQDELVDFERNGYESRPSVAGTGDRTRQNVRSDRYGDLDMSMSQQRASFTPSTPPLAYNSPLIPLEYLQAFYGDDEARRIALWRTESGAGEEPDRERWSRNLFPTAIGSTLNAAGYPGWRQSRLMSGSNKVQYGVFKATIDNSQMTWIPLHGIRKSLSARIVNCFVEEGVHIANDQSKKTGSRMAYTIWVYDVESGREWYAPIRYWKDFCDLREVAMTLLPPNSNLHKEISSLKIPKEPTIPSNSLGWSAAIFGSRISPLSPLQERRRQRQDDGFEEARNETCRILEEFLRELLGTIYTCEPLHPVVAEIALYVQSFLGVEAGLADDDDGFGDDRDLQAVVEREQDHSRQLLKSSIQRYTWRVFLLHTMKAIVNDFVDAARARGPKLQDIESLEAQGRASLKARALEDLETIQAFMDHLVDLVLDGCSDDLRSVADRQEYCSIRKFLGDATYWDRLVRESVREQVEIEVYVPLRSVVSRLLVNGWRHEDMEVHFKIKASRRELRKRPQGMLRIPEDKISPSHWQSVARILKQGVGMSTLPCVKLRAIVDAAREISRVHEREHGQAALLGADEFLPIFIFCVIRAEMERPCALCVLLITLCDRINRIGEIGYFLASFEAAITHIQEIDLTEDHEEMLSFLTVPLTEVSLND